MTTRTYPIHIPTAAPINTESSGRAGDIASQSVFRIVCPDRELSGTGFLHKSGLVITAAHVVKNSQNPLICLPSTVPLHAKTVLANDEIDIALLKPVIELKMNALPLSTQDNFAVGTSLSTWGFPSGYQGLRPMLSVGYLAGIDAWRTEGGNTITRLVVNAAFNRGNSGGPLLNIETGEVIGVVSSKLAPLSPVVQSILEALDTQKSGFSYTATLPNGTTQQFSEGQLIGKVLNELRDQIQLVIGYAVIPNDIRMLLGTVGVAP